MECKKQDQDFCFVIQKEKRQSGLFSFNCKLQPEKIWSGYDTFGPKRIWSPDIWSPTIGPSGQTVPNQFGPHGQMVPQNLAPLDKWSLECSVCPGGQAAGI